MSFAMNEEQKILINNIVKFAQNELNDDISEKDDKAKFDRDNWNKCADLGIMSMAVPEEYGGSGTDPITLLYAMEALSFSCKDNGLVHAIVTQVICTVMLELFGSEAQKNKIFPKIADGTFILAQAITEPGAGSDVLAMKSHAKKMDNHFLLNGRKTFTTNGPVADLVFVFAITNAEIQKFGGVSCLIVENGMQGFIKEKPIEKMGLRTLQNGDLLFEDCKVPLDNIIGKEGQGMIIFNETIEWERVIMASTHLGVLKRILDITIKYANTRVQFDNPISKYQSISHKIADIKVNYELAKLIVQKIGWLKENKKRAAMECSIAKLFVSESLKSAALEAIQIHGGYGFMKEFELERELRDSIAATIYSGTSEMQKNIISRFIGL